MRICLAGPFRLEVDGATVDTAGLGDQGRLALAFLVVERARPVRTHELAELVWDGALPATWRTALRGLVSKVRAVLAGAGLDRAEVVRSGPGWYQLVLPLDVVVDVEEAALDVEVAEQTLADGQPGPASQAAEAALGVASRPFLVGAEGVWVETRQRRLDEVRLRALEVSARALVQLGSATSAVEAAEAAVALDPLRESAHVLLMAAHAAAGNRPQALRVYERCRRLLAEELGISPSAGTEAAYLEVLGQEPDGRVPPLGPRPAGLPVETTSFVGRQGELVELAQLLERSRLVTITGLGGMGKSRLAREAARRFEAHGGRVVLVELAPLADPEHLLGHVAAALGLGEEPGVGLDRSIVASLEANPVLLLVDNCEHLIAAAAGLVARLLGTSADVRVLATSQERLAVPGETVLALGPLAAPIDAVRLFVDRARSALAGFEVGPDDTGALDELCRRLEGLPLALELAAACVPVLSVAEIAARLDNRFRLLAAGPRTGPERHRSLEAALEWSCANLTREQAALFRRLAVFRGGFSFDALAEVCEDEGLGVPALELLSDLVAASLVQAERRAGGSRYRMLETVRQFAAARLVDAGEETAMRQRHGSWAVALAERAEPGMEGPDQRWWLDLLEAELANLRAALVWSSSCPTFGLRLATALGRFWEVRGHLGEGRTWLRAALADHDALVPPEPPAEVAALRARALTAAAVLAGRQGDRAEARARYDECLVIQRNRGDRLGEAVALHGLGTVAAATGDLADATRCFEASLAIARRSDALPVVATALASLGGVALRRCNLDAAWSMLVEALQIQRDLGAGASGAWSLSLLGQVAELRGELDHARALHDESLELRRKLGDQAGIAESLAHLAALAMHQGDLAAARSLHEESLAVHRDLGDRAGVMASLRHLGDVDRLAGETSAAVERYHASLVLAEELDDTCCAARARLRLGRIARSAGDRAGASARFAGVVAVSPPPDDVVVEWLEAVAGLALDLDRPMEGARLLGAADARRRALGLPLAPAERHEHGLDVGRARAALGDGAFDAAERQGAAVPVVAVVGLAREVLG